VSLAIATSGEFTSMLQLMPEIAERLDASMVERLTQLR
jgi:hypothetical protein